MGISIKQWRQWGWSSEYVRETFHYFKVNIHLLADIIALNLENKLDFTALLQTNSLPFAKTWRKFGWYSQLEFRGEWIFISD